MKLVHKDFMNLNKRNLTRFKEEEEPEKSVTGKPDGENDGRDGVRQKIY